MADYIYSLILLAVALLAVELRKSYYEVPKVELQRLARGGDALASKLYSAVAYEESLDTLLWIVIILCLAGSLILFNQVAPLWLDFIAIILLIWLAFAWLPKVKVNSFSKRLVAVVTPAVIFVLNYVHPLFKKLNKTSPTKENHSGLYERKDLITLINQQKKQADNRINTEDLELVKKVLKLNDKTVADYSHNWSKVERVTAGEAIRPILLDELHKTGQMYIPVVSEAEPDVIVGMIDLNQLNITSNSVIGDQMNQNVYYLNEDDSLSEAIRSMASSGSPVFVVRDSKQRPIGLITLKDVIKQLAASSTETNQ